MTTAIHFCTHVLDLEKTMAFYSEALDMVETHRMGPADGSWVNVYMACPGDDFEFEFTWNDGRTEPYNNCGDGAHVAFRVDDFDAMYDRHKAMGCIIRENKPMGLYFIADPEGTWLEILPKK